MLGARATAQTPASDLPEPIIAYFTAIMESVPDDDLSKATLLDVLNAGQLTTVSADDISVSVSFLNEWSAAADKIDASSFANYIAPYHEELVAEIDWLAGALEYADLSDFTTSLAISSIGVTVMFIGATSVS
jgi:hypothetical protein